jgi:hypothetical protein
VGLGLLLPVGSAVHLQLLLVLVLLVPLVLLLLVPLPGQLRGFLNSMTQPPARDRERMAPEKAEWVSICADSPTPGVYSLMVSWSRSSTSGSPCSSTTTVGKVRSSLATTPQHGVDK